MTYDDATPRCLLDDVRALGLVSRSLVAAILLASIGGPETSRADEPASESRLESTPDEQARTPPREGESSDTSSERPRQARRGERGGEQTGDFGSTHRRELYQKGRLEYGRAALLTLAFPGLGNFYAEQYLLGGIAVTLMGFSALFVSYGFATDQNTFVWLGVGTAGGAYTGGLISSYVGVRAYNYRLRKRLRLSESTSAHRFRPPDVRGFSWTLFRF